MTNQLVATRGHEAVPDPLRQQPDRHLLRVTRNPGKFTIDYYGAVSFQAVNRPARAETLAQNLPHAPLQGHPGGPGNRRGLAAADAGT